MSRHARLNLGLFAALLIIAATAFGLVRYYIDLPQNLSQHEAVIIGQNRLFPGSEAAMRVLVRDSKGGAGLADADIEVALSAPAGGKPRTLYTGRTGQGGAADVSFHVPEDAPRESTLIVTTRSKLGSDRVERPVTIDREVRVLLTTDKPLYQPGQEMHIRALALSAFDLTPASGKTLEITIADGKGNKVFRQPLTTSEYGVAFVDFQLAGEVNTGAYKITAALDGTSAERTVTVEHYVLPKFAVKLKTDRAYYQPGQQVTGSLNAQYFFGKPVAEGMVVIEGFTYDVQRSTIFTLDGVTDADGNFAFSFGLPAYLAGSDLEGGLARFYLQAGVTDQAQHTESADLSLPVANSGLVIEAVPEASSFRPGVENILYVMTSTPDGRPATASLRVTLQNAGQVLEAQTGEYGLAEVRFTPDSPYQYILIEASDSQGSTAFREFQFEGEWTEESVLLRPDRPFYKAGETMLLTILTNQPGGSVYLDIVRGGQTISTRSAEVQDGKVEVAVDLTPDLYGTLDLHAYRVLPSGTIVRDTRLVVVEHANDLSVSLTPGQESYLPGSSAQINLQVNDPAGQGVQSAVGLAIVDESVFALAESDPGFARLYFLLEKEIMQPRYDLHGYSLPEMMRGEPAPEPLLEEAANGAAQASLAEAVRQSYSAKNFSLVANSHQDAVDRAQKQQRVFFSSFFKALFIAVILVPLLAAGLVLAALIREKAVGRGLLIWACGLAGLGLFFAIIPPPDGYAYGSGFLERVNGWLSWQMDRGEGLAVVMLLAELAGLVVLTVTAVRSKETLLVWLPGLALLHIVFLGLLAAFSDYADTSWANDTTGILLIAAYFLTPLALLLRSAGFFARRRALAAMALLPLAIFPLAGLLPLLSNGVGMMNSSKVGRDLGGPVMVEDGMPMPAAAGGIMKKVEEQAAGAMPENEMVEAPAGQAQGGEPPHLRQYFPETMLWMPDIITNPDGSLALDVPVADSITTWRMTALASSQDGRLGSVSAPLLVFQDFFIDLDLPLSLTAGDEVAVPVGVFNYLAEEQTVRLELSEADWFEPMGETVQEMRIAPNDISVVYFRIRALRFGMQPFQVTAWGSKMSDAIVKEVRVYPDGKEIRFSSSDRLNTGEPVELPVNIPAEAIPGTQSLLVKIYPGVLSQVVEGLDGMLRMPFGCFEQTTSITYPNLLIMDYLKTTGQAAPEAQMKAEEYINLGYQRLTTFEVAGGGFSLFGSPPADRMLTAYGLQEFSDMSRVHAVDADLIRRAADWLFAQQAADGSWENDQGLVHENTWSSLGNDRLPVTAYITWSLVEAGFGDDPRTQKGLQYVREYQGQAEEPYVLGLVANALVSADLKTTSPAISPSTAAVLDRLVGMAQRDGEGAYWQSTIATFVGGEGQTGSIETTALAALALLRAESNPEVANAALVYLVRQKDSFGTWHSTQATVLTLKALLQSVRGSGESTSAQITITLNGGQARTLSLTPENFDVVQMVSFDDINLGRENKIEIRAEGKGSMMYQVAGSYYLPWDKVALYPEMIGQNEAVTIDVAYDRTELAVNDLVTEQVTVRLAEAGAKAEQAMIDLGIPPGFTVQAEDLDAQVARFKDTPPDYTFPRIERYEMTGRQVLVYVTNLSGDTSLEFAFRLKANFPVSVQSPSSSAYDYYNPGVSGEIPPQRIIVNP